MNYCEGSFTIAVVGVDIHQSREKTVTILNLYFQCLFENLDFCDVTGLWDGNTPE